MNLKTIFGDTFIQMENSIYTDIRNILSMEQNARFLIILDKVFIYFFHN
jgi:hypothetical protein